MGSPAASNDRGSADTFTTKVGQMTQENTPKKTRNQDIRVDNNTYISLVQVSCATGMWSGVNLAR